jgi:hypothetical protein
MRLHSLGQPIFARGSASSDDVLDRFRAGDDIHTLSGQFGAPISQIEDVLLAPSRRAA